MYCCGGAKTEGERQKLLKSQDQTWQSSFCLDHGQRYQTHISVWKHSNKYTSRNSRKLEWSSPDNIVKCVVHFEAWMDCRLDNQILLTSAPNSFTRTNEKKTNQRSIRSNSKKSENNLFIRPTYCCCYQGSYCCGFVFLFFFLKEKYFFLLQNTAFIHASMYVCIYVSDMCAMLHIQCGGLFAMQQIKTNNIIVLCVCVFEFEC